LFQALPFCNCSAKVFKSLTEAPKTNNEKTKLNSYLNQFFSPDQCFDNRNQGNYPNQFSDNLDLLTLQDNKYNDSQNMSVLLENMKSKSTFKLKMAQMVCGSAAGELLPIYVVKSTLIVMHLNIKSLSLNFDKSKVVLSSLETQPHVITINETWLKKDQNGEFSSFLDYAFISNSRTTGGGVAFYIK